MNIGETLKNIRESKGLTQQQFAEGIVSRSFYTKVEKNKSNISADLLVKLLQKANVSFDEFEFISNGNQDNCHTKIVTAIRNAYYNSSEEELSAIMRELASTVKSKNKALEFYEIIIKNIIKVQRDETVVPEDLACIKDYLLEVPAWKRFEFDLFSLASIAFDSKTLIWLTHLIIKNYSKKDAYLGYDQEIILTLLNISEVLMFEKLDEEAYFYIKLTKIYTTNTLYMYEGLLSKLLEGIYLYRKGEAQGRETIEEVAQIFDYANIHNRAKLIIMRLV